VRLAQVLLGKLGSATGLPDCLWVAALLVQLHGLMVQLLNLLYWIVPARTLLSVLGHGISPDRLLGLLLMLHFLHHRVPLPAVCP
jgi:hypothetical protein